MKLSINFKLLLIAVLVFVATNANAQRRHVPRYVSDKGYWVVETDGATHLQQVHYYNMDGILTGSDTLAVGTRTQLSRVRMKLKRSMEASVSYYAARMAAGTDLELAKARK